MIAADHRPAQQQQLSSAEVEGWPTPRSLLVTLSASSILIPQSGRLRTLVLNPQPSLQVILHCCGHALIVAPTLYSWMKRPRFVLHGHSCATEEESARRQIPCSVTETLFSTQADLDALMDLLRRYPYPDHQIWVRKNHGFFLLADNEQEACHIFQTRLAP